MALPGVLREAALEAEPSWCSRRPQSLLGGGRWSGDPGTGARPLAQHTGEGQRPARPAAGGKSCSALGCANSPPLAPNARRPGPAQRDMGLPSLTCPASWPWPSPEPPPSTGPRASEEEQGGLGGGGPEPPSESSRRLLRTGSSFGTRSALGLEHPQSAGQAREGGREGRPGGGSAKRGFPSPFPPPALTWAQEGAGHAEGEGAAGPGHREATAGPPEPPAWDGAPSASAAQAPPRGVPEMTSPEGAGRGRLRRGRGLPGCPSAGALPMPREDDDAAAAAPMAAGMSDAHRHFLQALMALGAVGGPEAVALHRQCCERHRAPYAAEQLDDFIAEANVPLQPLFLEIRKGLAEDTGTTWYALVNLAESEVTHMASNYSEAELELFKKTMDRIILSENGFVSSTEILNLADQLKPKKMRKREAEQVLQRLGQDKWLSEKEGEFTLHPRCILELEQYILSHYPESSCKCHICHALVVQSQVCTECGITMHMPCLARYCQGQAEPRCPRCKQFWPHRIPVSQPAAPLSSSTPKESRRTSLAGTRRR
ncbi:non-structural maintenance of chromosomes element 1 homolog isoform X2 [Paroedura picta]|uniref:non-structural maintenance of chromosomes element 1 homolog isoform X2 n=1 Tax=Paroedura picta TaxID=143630 RepID=UPI004056C196